MCKFTFSELIEKYDKALGSNGLGISGRLEKVQRSMAGDAFISTRNGFDALVAMARSRTA